MRNHLMLAACVAIALVERCTATVTVITNKPQWISAIGTHSRIGFDEYPPDINITTQYASLGVTFTDGDDVTDYNPVYLDDHGLISDPAHFRMEYSIPVRGLAIELPGIMSFTLYDHGTLVYSSGVVVGEFTPFYGVISTTAFDEVIVIDPTGVVLNIDNLYFGPAVPAPGALLILLCGFASQSTRRRA